MIIAVIDDGINYEYYPSIGALEFNLEIKKNEQIVLRKRYDTKIDSHGTTCAAIIKKYFPQAKIASIKVISHDTRVGRPAQLIKALDFCTEKKIKLVHMSIGSREVRDIAPIREAVKRFQATGGIIVSALANSMKWSVPACLDKVLSVKLDKSLSDNNFFPNSQALHDVLFKASSNHTLENYLGEINITQSCNSFCAPVITAAVGKLLQENERLSHRRLLESLGINKLATYNQKIRNTRLPATMPDMPIIEIAGDKADSLAFAHEFASFMTGKGYPCLVFSRNKHDAADKLGYIPSSISVKKFIAYHENLLDLSAAILVGSIYKKPDCRIFICETAKKITCSGDDITIPTSYSKNQLNKILSYFEEE